MPILDVTDRCNLNCTYCCRGSHAHDSLEPSNAILLDIIKQMIQLRATFVVLQGGEPLLKKNILDLLNKLSDLKLAKPGYYLYLLRQLIDLRLSGRILATAYKKKLIDQTLPLYCLTTNGMFFNMDILQALYKSGFYLEVSLDSENKAINQKNRAGICHETVIANIKKYAEILPVEISCTITKDNVRFLENLLRFSSQLGVICVKFSPVIMIGKNRNSEKEFQEEYFSVMESVVKNASKLLKCILLKVKIYPYFLKQYDHWRNLYSKILQTPNILLEYHTCNAFRAINNLYVDTNLDVYGCASMKNNTKIILGNLHNKPLKDIWFSERRQVLLTQNSNYQAILDIGQYSCSAAAYSFM
jgi:MoaA/NifB/PqqE/SkfB family radical SAM enzyme